MAEEQKAVDRNAIKLQPLAPPMGLLEHLNVPLKVVAFMRRNQQALWLVLAVVVIATIALPSYITYSEYRAEKAATALDAALVAKQGNRPLLEAVVREYGSTSSALWATIELAFLDEKEGQRDKAIVGLEAINTGISARSPLKPLVLTKLAGLLENEQQFAKAIPLYMELAFNEHFAPEAYRALGRVNEQIGKQDEAAAMYGKYLELLGSPQGQGRDNPMRDMVQSRLNQLKKQK